MSRSSLCLATVAVTGALSISLASCVSVPRSSSAAGTRHVITGNYAAAVGAPQRVRLNAASQDELERLPGIGPSLANRIIEHRRKYGRFRQAEHLMLVPGISERRFQEMRRFIEVE